jgi:WD40 repeat protein
MKLRLLFNLLVLICFNVGAQNSLDSLRLVLPVGSNNQSSSIYSPDGRYILITSDNSVYLWQSKSGKLLFKFEGHKDKINSAKFSSDNKKIVTASDDKTARIWDIKTGKTDFILQHDNHVRNADFNSKGDKILTTSDYLIRTWDVNNGNLLMLFRGHEFWINSAFFSKNGNFILSSSMDGSVRLWDSNKGTLISKFTIPEIEVIQAIFSPDDKKILASYKDFIAREWDILTGKLLKIYEGHNEVINSISYNLNGKKILTSSRDNTARIWDSATGQTLHVLNNQVESANNEAGGVTSAYFSPDGKKIITLGGFNVEHQCYGTRIWDSETGKLILYFKGHLHEVKSLCFSPNGKYVLSTMGNLLGKDITFIFELNSGKIVHSIKLNSVFTSRIEFNYKSKGSQLLQIEDQNYVRIIDLSTGNYLTFNDCCGNNSKKWSGNLRTAFFSPDGNYVITACFNNLFRVWDLKSGMVIKTFEEKNRKNNPFNEDAGLFAKFSPDMKRIVTMNHNSAKLWDYNSGQIIKILFNEKNDKLIYTLFSPDNKYLFTIGEKSMSAWELNSGELVKSIYFDISNIIFNSAELSPEGFLEQSAGKYILLACSDNVARIWEWETGSQIKTFAHQYSSVNFARFSPNGSQILTGADSDWILWDSKTDLPLRKQFGKLFYLNVAAFSPNGEHIITTNDKHQIQLWNIKNSDLDIYLNGHSDGVWSAEFDPSGKTIYSSDAENKSILWNVKTGLPIYERNQLENNNWLIKLPNSPYYMCSKDASKMLHYVTPSLKVIGFEQLDPVYNRPDIVLDSIGKYFGGADQELVASYRQSWEKRIDRLGLDKEKLGKGEIAVPDAEIVDADEIVYENKDGKLIIKVKANDPKYTLRRFNVYVNEVPLYGSAGISIAQLKKQQWDTTLSVPLSLGENKIQVSVMNELGLENFKYPTYVNYSPVKEIVAKTHFIGIGVNKFKEAGHILNYCVKDVRDLAKAFSAENTQIDTLLFTDEQVTRENILALKDYLKKTSVNDKVIISCSSHGLLDDSRNFYLATHDVDFSKPAERGLKYEELEGLLDGIPARQKLLLLDACNSGENDKTELHKQDLANNERNMNVKEVEGAKGVIPQMEEENTNNFKKMNELFVNVRNNTGSVIISAAGGMQRALEAIQVDGKTIENGAFTYSILECLKQNEGKELKVNTLKQYAEKRVEEITNGKQKPTSRQETMEIDWVVR